MRMIINLIHDSSIASYFDKKSAHYNYVSDNGTLT